MNYDKLTETLRQHGVSCVRAYGKYCSICDEAATALSTLQAENSQLRADLEYEREHANAYHEECGQWEAENAKLRVLSELGNMRAKDYRVMRDRAVNAEAENEKLRAELEQVKRERDAAIKDLNEFLSMDELCPIQCEWCKWNDTFCDGKTPEWRGIKED